ncbi:MAG: choice-of-anchor J domain-containing protein, partial [Bacteroidota bacterium]
MSVQRLLTRLLFLSCCLFFAASPLKADILFNATFNGGTLPAGWSTTAIQGTDVWTVRNAPAFGSPSAGHYAVFDDAALGPGVTPTEAALYTPVVDLTGRTNVTLRYSHHWFGVENTFGHVEYSTDGGSTWTTHTTYELVTEGSLATPADVTIDLTTELAGQSNVQLRFRYDDGNQAGRYWYLDDIALYANPDAGVIDLLSPLRADCGDVYTASESVTVQFVNFSYETVSNVPIVCEVTGGATSTLNTTIAGPVASGDTVSVTFPGTVDMSANATYHFLIYTNIAADAYHANDTLRTGRQPHVNTYPYFTDFNPSDAGWYARADDPTNTDKFWTHGFVPYLGGSGGEGRSWYLSVNDISFDQVQVYSPPFDFSNQNDPVLSMDIKLNLENITSNAGHVEV